MLISSTAAYRFKWGKEWLPLITEPLIRASVPYPSEAIEKLSGREAYALSKWGVLKATKHFAREYGSRRIRVNCVVSGPTKTAMSQPLWSEAPQYWNKIISENPFKEANSAKDVAGLIAFLLSPASKMIHDSFIHIDGGWYSYHAEN